MLDVVPPPQALKTIAASASANAAPVNRFMCDS
jgi:hypothetical protein